MNPLYHRAVFLAGATSLSRMPPDSGCEVAIAGRSNAGKSSAINAITGIHALARTSKTPGRTRQINFFALDERRRLVDLPGYGYARAPQDHKRRWGELVEGYLHTRHSLRGLVLVMDSRHPLTPFDIQLIHWCRAARLPIHVLLTKSDKLSRGAASAVLHRVHRALCGDAAHEWRLADRGDECPTVQLFSSLKGAGVEEAHARLDAWLRTKKAPVK